MIDYVYFVLFGDAEVQFFLFGKQENEGAANLCEFFDQFLPQNLVPSYNITPYLRRLNLYPQFSYCTSHSTKILIASRQVRTTTFESTTVGFLPIKGVCGEEGASNKSKIICKE